MTKQQIVKEIHRETRKNFERRKYTMRGINDTLQADLIEMQQFKTVNRGYRYILIVIDVFSKRAYAEPLKQKTGKATSEAMEKNFNRIGERIQNLQTDDGTEFFNRTMKRVLARFDNVNHYSTFSVKKASIVERLIRTIKRKMYMHFSLHGSYQWYDILNDIISTYNNTW